MSAIPRDSIRVARHPHGAGWATVIHRASGVVLGTVVLWPDGMWIVYLPYVDERCDEGCTREDAIECLLCEGIHTPPGFERRDKDHRYLRDATEAEARTIAPEAWAHWDRVAPLFATCDAGERTEATPATDPR